MDVSLIELFIIAVGLSMDAFAVSVCKGLSVRKAELKNALCVGIYFGGFQALMPLIGYLLGTQFQTLITSVDHWIAFVLLVLHWRQYGTGILWGRGETGCVLHPQGHAAPGGSHQH